MRVALLALPLAAALVLATVSTAGLPADTGDTAPRDTAADTGGDDTGSMDTSPAVGAAGLAGEDGGCAGCAVPGTSLAGLLPLLAALLLVRRRR